MVIKTFLTFFVAVIFLIINSSNQLAAVNYGSGNYGDCVYGGEIGDDALTFSVNTISVDMGSLSASTTASTTATFDAAIQCSDYGYSVTMVGTAPSNGSHTLNNLSSPTASAIGTEQYGINLKDNATPNVGANPSGGEGIASSGYDTADQYKYVSGNTIAQAANSTATTTYTVSFIANVTGVTPAGTYTTTHTLICTATY